ncbi:MAG: hypothetical protein D3904_13100 [Candidatus Electrothrix sp. EH2]|nr:hypothetical protein [Candidatus Electrothrix sp. EH2]
MPELKLFSPGKREIRAIVEAALENELCLLEAGIRRTEHKLRTFEEKYTQWFGKFFSTGYLPNTNNLKLLKFVFFELI